MQRMVAYCVNGGDRPKQSKAMIKRYYKKGESVFRVGEPSSAVFLLISGEIGLFFPTDLSEPYMHIRECETFGEMGLIENELRNARASCLTDCLIVHIERVDFEAKYENADPLIRALVRSLSSRLRDANRKLSTQQAVAIA